MNKKIVVHGHRGSRGTHPENTLPAFQEAIDAGADFLELDVHLTADDQVVVVHDPELTGQHCRDASGKPVKAPILVRKLTLAELKKFDCGAIKQEKFPEQKLIPHTTIPTLEEVVQLRAKNKSKIQLNIETKMDGSDIPPPELMVTKVLDVLRKHDVIEASLLQSFDFSTVKISKKLEPKLRLACLFDEGEKNICQRAADIGVQFVSPDYSLVNAAEVELCHAKGMKVVPWTLNDADHWRLAIAAGVDGIITDYPRKLIQTLSTKVSTSK